MLYQKLEWLADDRLIGVLRVDGQALGFGSIHLGTGETKSFSPAPTWGRFAASPDGQWLAYTTTLDQPGQQSGNDDQRMAKLDGPVRLDKSGWLSLRASGPGHADHPVGSLDAHTSPIYVQLTGSPSGTREDAAYFLKWIDRLSLALRLRDRVPNDAMRQHIQTQLESARAVYSKIVEAGQ